jgi:hypothetical protein
VTPAAIGQHDDDLDLVFQEVDRMEVGSSQTLCITKPAEGVEQLRNAGVESNLDGAPHGTPPCLSAKKNTTAALHKA